MSPGHLYCKIIEYEISWPKDIKDISDVNELKKLYCEKGHEKSKF